MDRSDVVCRGIVRRTSVHAAGPEEHPMPYLLSGFGPVQESQTRNAQQYSGYLRVRGVCPYIDSCPRKQPLLHPICGAGYGPAFPTDSAERTRQDSPSRRGLLRRPGALPATFNVADPRFNVDQRSCAGSVTKVTGFSSTPTPAKAAELSHRSLQ